MKAFEDSTKGLGNNVYPKAHCCFAPSLDSFWVRYFFQGPYGFDEGDKLKLNHQFPLIPSAEQQIDALDGAFQAVQDMGTVFDFSFQEVFGHMVG